MVDSINYTLRDRGNLRPSGKYEVDIEDNAAHPYSPFKICSCDRCRELIYQCAVEPKFLGYSPFDPDTVPDLTEHQYFICSRGVAAFVFKLRTWGEFHVVRRPQTMALTLGALMRQHLLEWLHVDGFQEPVFDRSLFDYLVLKDSTKELIKSLTEMYVKDSAAQSREEGKYYTDITTVHRRLKPTRTQPMWSADFVQGKGDSLVFLLHGKPGVGRTYTAGRCKLSTTTITPSTRLRQQ